MDNFIVITGGPGAGKTTLLDELESRGFTVIPEVARQIIREQVAAEGNALPWDDREEYKRIMLDRSVADFMRMSPFADKWILFDRGIVDTIGYARLIDSEITTEMHECAEKLRYNKNVFILPFWEEIYMTDKERKQSKAEAIQTYRTLSDTYGMYGYHIIEVPLVSPAERAKFVIDILGALKENILKIE